MLQHSQRFLTVCYQTNGKFKQDTHICKANMKQSLVQKEFERNLSVTLKGSAYLNVFEISD